MREVLEEATETFDKSPVGAGVATEDGISAATAPQNRRTIDREALDSRLESVLSTIAAPRSRCR
jgi:hypothetical protein